MTGSSRPFPTRTRTSASPIAWTPSGASSSVARIGSSRLTSTAAACAAAVFLASCPSARKGPSLAPGPLPALFDDIQARTFRYFWELANPGNGLVPDRQLPEVPERPGLDVIE